MKHVASSPVVDPQMSKEDTMHVDIATNKGNAEIKTVRIALRRALRRALSASERKCFDNFKIEGKDMPIKGIHSPSNKVFDTDMYTDDPRYGHALLARRLDEVKYYASIIDESKGEKRERHDGKGFINISDALKIACNLSALSARITQKNNQAYYDELEWLRRFKSRLNNLPWRRKSIRNLSQKIIEGIKKEEEKHSEIDPCDGSKLQRLGGRASAAWHWEVEESWSFQSSSIYLKFKTMNKTVVTVRVSDHGSGRGVVKNVSLWRHDPPDEIGKQIYNKLIAAHMGRY